VGRNGQGQTRVPAGWRLQGYGAKRWSLRSFVAPPDMALAARHGTKAKVRATPPGWTAVRPTETYEPQAVTEV